MKKRVVHGVVLAVGLAFSVGAMAQGMTKVQYEIAQTGISAEFKLAKAACDSFSAHAKDLCLAEASGKEKVATAELNARFAPSEAANYKVRLARADAEYALARQKCDDPASHVKDVCVKEAEATAVTAKANAKAHMKTALAHDAAFEKSSKAQDVADVKEKCDAMAGDAKGNCVRDATARASKP